MADDMADYLIVPDYTSRARAEAALKRLSEQRFIQNYERAYVKEFNGKFAIFGKDEAQEIK